MFKGGPCGPLGSGGESGLDLEGGGDLLGGFMQGETWADYCVEWPLKGTGVVNSSQEADTRQESIPKVPGVSLRA